MMSKLLQALNRFGGIVIWVGVWNLIVMIVPDSSLVGNICLSLFGLIIWIYTKEFDPPNHTLIQTQEDIVKVDSHDDIVKIEMVE